MADNLVELPSLSKWPQSPVFKPIDQLSEIYFLDRVWKTVEVTYLQSVLNVVDESAAGFEPCKAILENYIEKNLVIGYNPFSTEARVFLCPTLESVQQLQDKLRALQQEYKARVQHAKVFTPRYWTSLGSEEEVDQERTESTREKISVEWIGCLEKRQTKVGQFIDVDTKDTNNGYEEIIAEDKKQYTLEPKTQLHIGVQVDIKQQDGNSQSDITQHEVEIIQTDLEDTEENINVIQSIESSQKFGQISTFDVPIDSEERLNYFKSFVNIEKRQKIIASVAWHPTRLGFVAIAYIDGTGIDSNENMLHVGNKVHDKTLIPDKESVIHDADVTVNEAIFDILSRQADNHLSDDSDENFLSASENGVESDEESNAGLPRNFKMSDILIYQNLKNHESSETTTEEKIADSLNINQGLISELLTLQRDYQHGDDDDKWSSTSSEETITSEDSRESETGTETTQHSLLNIPLYEDDFSDNSSSEVEEVPYLDTDSFVLIWNCDNDLFPQMKLYNVHEIQIIRFCLINGNYIAGGSSSGQLVLWSLENKFHNPPHKSRLENRNIIREFMENLPLWSTEDDKYPTLHPIVVSECSISHLYPITCLEWLHPSLMVTSTGALVKVKTEENEFSEQIFTSSTDGTIKIWDLKKKRRSLEDLNSSRDLDPHYWTLDLLYNLLVTNPHSDKYWTPIRIFKVFTPSVKYSGPQDDGCYQYVSALNSKFDMMVAITNEIGEIGVIRWSQKKSDEIVPKKAERCEHVWWGICHDDLITSMSQNYFFPQIILTVGGHIFALWNVEFKTEPIWWQQYPAKITITEGFFTPFHPGIIYITRSDGFVDIWDITKQIHKPVSKLSVSGFSISAFSVSVPPCPTYQVGIADSNGNFHILKNRYDMTWDENDVLVVGQFFERAKESRRQLLRWNRTWKQQSTFTDKYGFEHKSQKKKFQKLTKRPEKIPVDTSESKKTEKERIFPESATFLEKIVQSEEYKEELAQILTKMKFLYEEKYEGKKQEVLTAAQNIVLDDLPVDEIHDKYLT